MTHDHRADPDDPHARDRNRDDDTQAVQRQQYAEREREPEHYGPPRAQQARGGQVNVNAEGRGTTVATGPGPLAYARRVMSLLFGILVVLILLRILLLLLVANETNAIVDAIYAITEPFVAPFRGIFNFDAVSPGGASVLDIAAVVALIGWFLIYLLIMAILSLGDRRTA